MTVVVVDKAELAVVVFTAPPDGVTRAHPIAPSPLRANAARLSNRPYRLLTQAPQAGPSGDLTRCRPIGGSPLRDKCCAFVQSPYKPSGALTRRRVAAQGGDGTPHPRGMRRMSQGQGGCVQSAHGAAGIIRAGGAACQAAFVSVYRIRRNSAGTRMSTAESISLFGGGQGMDRLAQDFKPPGEMPRRAMPLLVLLSGAGMGPLVAFFACRGMNL